MAVSKFMPITYMCTVFVFILGFCLLGEKIYLTDILGAGLIIFFQLYNVYFPPGRKIDENNIDIKNKDSSIKKCEDDNINNNKNEKLIENS